MDKICKNCMYWGNDFEANDRGEKDCTGYGCRPTKNQIWVEINCDDDQGLDIIVWTKPEFFCANFKTRKVRRYE